MVQIETPDIFGRFQQGVAQGEDSRRRKTLSDYLQPAISGDKQALGMVFNADPSAGLQAQALSDKRQAQIGDEEFARLERLGKTARTIVSLPPQLRRAAYQQALPELSKSFPGEWAPDWSEDMLPLATQLAQALDPESAEQFTLAPGSKRFDASGKVVAEAPFAPANLQTLPTDQGYATFDPRTGSTAPLSYGGTPELPVAPGIDMSRVQRALAMLGGRSGVQMTSGLRSPEHNSAVGGKPNSQHLRGTAGDYVVPADQKAAFIAEAQQNGLHAIDEGDHVHVQAGQGSNGGRVMPPAKDAAPSELERRLAIAQGMGASDEQLRGMVMGETGGGKPSATQIKLANTAKQKLIDLNAMENQLDAVETAYGRLKGTYSAGLGGRFLPTEDGRRFDAAVSLLKTQVRKLTRTPGEGAMSDYESKLAELANPSRNEFEQVTADQLDQLKELVKTSREGYEALLQDAGGSADNVSRGGNGAGSGNIDELLEKYK